MGGSGWARIPDAEEAEAMTWLHALCTEGRFEPPESTHGLGDDVDREKLSMGQRVAMDNLFSLAYAELLSMLMVFAFEDQTVALVFTEESDTPRKAYFRYLSTMRRVRTWYEGDLLQNDSEACRNLQAVRRLHAHVGSRMDGAARTSLHAARAPDPAPTDTHTAAQAAREAFAGCEGPSWAVDDYDSPPVMNQRAMAVTQVGFVGLFILQPGRFGAHATTERELDALVYLWGLLGRALGLSEGRNVCAAGLGAARARSAVLVRECVLPRLAAASPQWQRMAGALCDGAALAAPGNSLPLSLSALADALRARHAAVEPLLSRRDRVWRWAYHFVLDGCMRHRVVRDYHNTLFRLALWVSKRAARFATAKYELA